MSIKESIQADLKSALLSGDKNKALTLKQIKSSVLDAEIAEGKRDTGLEEPQMQSILAKECKKRQDAAKMYADANETERAQKELDEIEIIKVYLPEQMPDEDLSRIVAECVNTLGIEKLEQKDMGRVIGAVKGKVDGGADGSRIAQAVKSLIN
jgi:uncharacterized protein YqeY